MIVLLYVSAFIQIRQLKKLAKKQIVQVTRVAFLKKEEIRSKTLAELKQNEFNLMHQD